MPGYVDEQEIGVELSMFDYTVSLSEQAHGAHKLQKVSLDLVALDHGYRPESPLLPNCEQSIAKPVKP
jgi:hypothetical protein